MAVSKNRKLKQSMRRRSSRDGGGVIMGIFIGLILGALLATGAAWYLMRSSPFQVPPAPAPATNDQTSPRALPGKPGDAPVGKQDFEFYRILSQGNDGGSASPTAPANATARTGTAPSAGGQVAAVSPGASAQQTAPSRTDRLYLQVGAFANLSEADNMKALLALNGIDASSQQARLDDGRVVHRVRIGPFNATEEMGPVRSRLAAAGLTASVIRVSP